MTTAHLDSSDPIRVWHATSSTAGPGPIERCCHSWLDESERQRAERFRVATSRNQNVVGRGMARRLLSSDRFDPRAIRFDVEPHGKPFVSDPIDAKRPFNIAHTDGLVLCGVGSGGHQFVGVDVERLGRRTDPELAERYFSRPEVEYLSGFRSAEKRHDVFLRIWTLKESFIKAIGTGLQTPLADFAFEEIESDSPKIRMLSAQLESDLIWNFFCVEPRPGYVGAIAVGCRKGPHRINVELRCFDDLITSVPDNA
jgi:4'-phosphopantetheinyl transferase